jgi:hypothetical protein
MRTKSDILKGFAPGLFHYESREVSDLKVRVYADTSVVIGRSVQKGMENGKDYSGDYRFTRVYIKQKGRWLTIALRDNPNSAIIRNGGEFQCTKAQGMR